MASPDVLPFPKRTALVSVQPESPKPPERRSTGANWAIAMALLIVACLVLPILLIRSAMQRVRSLGGTAESALISVRTMAEAFRTGKIETSLKTYASELKGVSRFQFAELKQLESFERTDSASLVWGMVPLPDVVVEARGNVVYTYYLDFKKPWDIRLHNGFVDVTVPQPEPGVPALDPSSLTFEVKKDSVLRDEAAVRTSLQAGLSGLLNERAQRNIGLVKETGRKATEDFVRNFLVSSYDDAANYVVRVRFLGEPEAPPVMRPSENPPLRR